MSPSLTDPEPFHDHSAHQPRHPRRTRRTLQPRRDRGWAGVCIGSAAYTPSGEKLNQACFDDQARQVLANVSAALAAADTGVAQLVQVRVYVTDIGHWPAFNAIYAQWAGDSRPARAVVPVPMLHHDFLIEVEAVATQ